MTKEAIFSDKLPTPAGPFVPANKYGDTVYVSGQIGQDPKTGKLVEGGVLAEAEAALQNFSAILEAAGKDFSSVIRACIYLTDMDDFARVNEVYAKYAKEPFPARTCIAVAALPLGASFEIDAIVEG